MTTRSDLQSVRRRRAAGRARVTAERSEGSPKGLARARRTEDWRRRLRKVSDGCPVAVLAFGRGWA